MEDKNITSKESEVYTRPLWQRIGAIAGVIIMLVGFLLYCWQIANGGI